VASHVNLNKASAAGVLIAFGIIFGDIGTSPLYVFSAITKGRLVDEALIIGSLSCILWTLTFQTTLKYVYMVLNADNKGEGGTFALYALVRRRKKWLVAPAMIGGAALLADGIITPPISITSAIEGLRELPPLHGLQQSVIVSIVIVIISLFFFMQQFGTESIGKLFGPIMFIWFTMLAILGLTNLSLDWNIFTALNPVHAIEFLVKYPGGFWLLGAVFLCTTGAEALYSDLGHCGKPNIRISWIYVKICLILNYFGQGAYLLAKRHGQVLTPENIEKLGMNAFYDIMPSWFIIPGVIIATMAAIIASQAMISGSYTLISEATRLNLWPKMKINFPTNAKGQIYIPGMNTFMFIGCVLVVLFFQSSANMEAAYGLAIILTMLMTTILFANYMVIKRFNKNWIYLFLAVYLTIEIAFLIANIIKFPHGGYATFVVAGLMFAIMFVWFKSRKIKNRYVEFVRMDDHIHQLQELSNDPSIPRYATHLVYLTSANNPREIEHKIIYSILNKKPKRADIYWFIHVDVVDEPYKTEYIVETIIPNEIIRIEFRLGFRVEQRINLMFRKVVEDMVANKEVNITSRYTSLQKNKIAGDWQFIVMEKFLSHDNDLPLFERLIMRFYFLLKKFSLSEEKGFGLDSSYVTIEKYPLVVTPVTNLNLVRKEN
jgi:KUP system potassium uptake protein